MPEDVGPLVPGARVAAPFGSALATGLVASLDPPPPPEGTVERDVVAALDDAPFLPERLVSVLVRAAAYYLVPPGEILRSAVPARLLAASEAVYVPLPGPSARRRKVSRGRSWPRFSKRARPAFPSSRSARDERVSLRRSSSSSPTASCGSAPKTCAPPRLRRIGPGSPAGAGRPSRAPALGETAHPSCAPPRARPARLDRGAARRRGLARRARRPREGGARLPRRNRTPRRPRAACRRVLRGRGSSHGRAARGDRRDLRERP